MSEAQRQQAKYGWLSPEQAGRLLGGVTAEQVRQHIHDGELTAYDARSRDASRPDWRIKPEWVQAFLARRTVNGEKASAA